MNEKHFVRLTQDETQRLMQSKKYILEHLHLRLTVKQLEKVAGMNKEKLNAGFEQLFGKKAMPFVKEMKMQTALFLLRNTDKPIKDIAALVGYRYTDNFLTAFKKQFHFTATHARKNSRLF